MATKKELARALICKIIEEKRLPEVKYERWFLDENTWGFIELLKTRKQDLPSIEYLQKELKFEPFQTTYTLKDIMEALNRQYVKDSLEQMFNYVVETCDDKTFSPTDLIREFKKSLNHTDSVVTVTNNTSLEETDAFITDYENWQQLKEPLPTGLERIDTEAPFRRGELVCLIAGTNAGKSLVTSKMCATNMQANVRASLFSLEMGRLQVLMRLFPILTKGRIKNSDLRHGVLTKEEFQKEINKLPKCLNIITRKSSVPIKVSTIEAHLEEQKVAGKPVDVVYIDYVGLLDQDLSWNAEEKIAAQLKRLAIQYNCLIVMLAQADTETSKSGNMPSLTSIADNKGMARDCDSVFALKSCRLNDADNRLLMEFQMLKRREDGAFINFQMKVDPNKGLWEEAFYAAP